MLSGLHQTFLITPEVPSLVNFWNAGINAYRAYVTYAVKSQMPTPSVFTVFESQRPLLSHIHKEFRVFKHSGWKSNTNLFQRWDDLTAEDKWQLERFGHDILNRELQLMTALIHHVKRFRNFDRFKEYVDENFRLFPPLEGIIRGMCRKFALQAHEKRITINTSVESALQFASPVVFSRAKSIFENLIDNSIKYGRIGGCVDVSMGGLALYFEDDGFGMAPAFADRLLSKEKAPLREMRVEGVDGNGIGWRSIKENAAALGWDLAIGTAVDRGTRVAIKMNDKNFASDAVVERREEKKRDTHEIMIARNLSSQDMIEGARGFIKAPPFKGYERTDDGDIDVRHSPIFQAIISGKELLEPLEDAKRRGSGRVIHVPQ